MLEIRDQILRAPPGCGKTEWLGAHAAAVVEDGLVSSPSQILALSFTRRATANLRSRVDSRLGMVSGRRFVCATNFHGLAARLCRYHGSVVGLDPSMEMPQLGWLSRLRREIAGATSCRPSEIADIAREAKLGTPLGGDPLDTIRQSGHPGALQYEEFLRDHDRVDYDDLVRLGVEILSVPDVLELYRARFAMVLIDEAQDLSRVQFHLVDALSRGRGVFAGDRAQGIFRFAGAEPDWVFAQILKRKPQEVQLDRSYRSSPAVLKVVSALAFELGGSEIVSAIPKRWEGRGKAGLFLPADESVEASFVVDMAKRWLDANPTRSLGVISRSAPRRRFVDRAVEEIGLAAQRWDSPVHSPPIVQMLRRHVGRAVGSAGSSPVALEELYRLAFSDIPLEDIDLQDELISAVDLLSDELAVGGDLLEIVSTLRVENDHTTPTPAGLHLLTVHAGKGQQFDRVVALGLEEEFLPSYQAIASGDDSDLDDELAILHVLASRAAEDILFTCSASFPTAAGKPRKREPSRWLQVLAPHLVTVGR